MPEPIVPPKRESNRLDSVTGQVRIIEAQQRVALGWMQFAAFVGVVIVVGLTVWLTIAFQLPAPVLACVATLTAGYAGKAFGLPVRQVMEAALARMGPDRVAELAVNAITQMQPAQKAAAAQTIINSIRPASQARRASTGRDVSFTGGTDDPQDNENT